MSPRRRALICFALAVVALFLAVAGTNLLLDYGLLVLLLAAGMAILLHQRRMRM
jgi:hypothetical protein